MKISTSPSETRYILSSLVDSAPCSKMTSSARNSSLSKHMTRSLSRASVMFAKRKWFFSAASMVLMVSSSFS